MFEKENELNNAAAENEIKEENSFTQNDSGESYTNDTVYGDSENGGCTAEPVDETIEIPYHELKNETVEKEPKKKKGKVTDDAAEWDVIETKIKMDAVFTPDLPRSEEKNEEGGDE